MRPLQERLDEYREASRSRQSPLVRQALEDGISSLRSTHPEDRYIRQGDVFPDFTLPDSKGTAFNLRASLANGPVVLSFYRGFWCPYCNLELKALAEVYETVRSLGAELVAISPQTAANSERAVRQGELPFRILIDAGNRVAASAGLRHTLDAGLAGLYASLGVNLPLINGDGTWSLPIPARILVAPDRRVASIHADPDYTRRPEPRRTLDELAALHPGPGEGPVP